MRNLAQSTYDPKIDEMVKEELLIAKIPLLKVSVMDSEVKTHYIGILNGFVFERAWTYWVVRGWMPMVHAKYLYENFKDLNIRADGGAGNDNPEKQHVYTDPAYEKRLLDLRNSCSNLKEFLERSKEIKENPEDPKFINTYHIDTQMGLCKIAEVIKQFDIHTEFVNFEKK